jgi:hypothetical protein
MPPIANCFDLDCTIAATADPANEVEECFEKTTKRGSRL